MTATQISASAPGRALHRARRGGLARVEHWRGFASEITADPFNSPIRRPGSRPIRPPAVKFTVLRLFGPIPPPWCEPSTAFCCQAPLFGSSGRNCAEQHANSVIFRVRARNDFHNRRPPVSTRMHRVGNKRPSKFSALRPSGGVSHRASPRRWRWEEDGAHAPAATGL